MLHASTACFLRVLPAFVIAIVVAMPSDGLAADMRVQYDVEDRPFKSQVNSSSLLTFALYSDPACTVEVMNQELTADELDYVEIVKFRKIRGKANVPRLARINVLMSAVASASTELYLKVTGTGIVPSVRACQPQSSTHDREPLHSKVVIFTRSHLVGNGNQAVTGAGFRPTAIFLSCAASGPQSIGGSWGAADEAGAVSRIVYAWRFVKDPLVLD